MKKITIEIYDEKNLILTNNNIYNYLSGKGEVLSGGPQPRTLVLTNCVLTGSRTSITGNTSYDTTLNDTNTQYSWSAPSYPAWNAVQSAFSNGLLSVGILSGTGNPEPGNPPYTGYETGLWGSARVGIGAMDFPSAVPPVIDVQPSNQQVTIGGTLNLSVTAHGTGTLHYQWKKGGVNVGTDSASYVKVGFANTDRGTYTVNVTDDVGTTTSSGAIVTTNPSITTQPPSVSVRIGGLLSLSVVATGYAPITYQWNKGVSPIGGQTGSSLSINPFSLNDRATYTCDVTCDGNTVRSNGAIISVVPVITTQPLTQEVLINSSIRLSVGVSGYAPFTYQWKKNTVSISGATSSSYVKNNYAESDSGSYSVDVTGDGNTVSSNPAILPRVMALLLRFSRSHRL
ncbi:MAG: immunoglobulin domain-containing protein [Nitrospirae bacterium]|nr:immunoglobulin domain-containing protein [Nitrospirota bacterium]